MCQNKQNLEYGSLLILMLEQEQVQRLPLLQTSRFCGFKSFWWIMITKTDSQFYPKWQGYLSFSFRLLFLTYRSIWSLDYQATIRCQNVYVLYKHIFVLCFTFIKGIPLLFKDFIVMQGLALNLFLMNFFAWHHDFRPKSEEPRTRQICTFLIKILNI